MARTVLRVVLSAMVVGLLAGCDGCDDDGAATVDAQVEVDAGVACEPLGPPGAQGCAAGSKCTWIALEDGAASRGVVGCVPDGSVALGGACTQGAPGATTGFDNCTAGNVCIDARCHDVCGFDGAAGAACANGSACARYAGLFANGDDAPIAGGCQPICDPLTQMVFGGGACPAGDGCYALTSATTTIAVCARAGSTTHGQPITGAAFANSCAPRHAPRRPGPGALTWECGALCQPLDVTSTTNRNFEGGNVQHTCESMGASPPDSASAGESCRYHWAREPGTSPSPFSNTLGFCWKHAAYQYDSNGDTTPDAPFPRCITLTSGDVVPPIGTPPHNDAVYFWCRAHPETRQAAVPGPGTVDRLGPWR